MQIDIITAFPTIVKPSLSESIVARAVAKSLIRLNIHDLRDWASDKHKTIDDAPYGGGAGMVYKIEPLYKALSQVCDKYKVRHRQIILTSPRGERFNQDNAVKFSLLDQLIIICGHYKGIDERIKSFFPVREVSVGDYILSGGELPAAVITDAVVRLVPGVLSDIESAMTDSFHDDLLDCDYYTRPESFNGEQVPRVLLSGDHKKIEKWRLRSREEITKKNRPDLYRKYNKDKR